MILYSLHDVAKFLGCAKKTVQRMVERREMPTPVREEKDAGGKAWRLWDSAQLEEIKNKVQERQNFYKKGSNMSTKVDKNKRDKNTKKSSL